MSEEAMTARDFWRIWKPIDGRKSFFNDDTFAFAEAYHAYRTRCELKDAREGLGAITEALKEPAGGSWHPLREFCNKRGIYNEDIADERVLRRVAAFILESLPAPEERK